MTRILVVDDEPHIVSLVTRALRAEGFDCATADGRLTCSRQEGDVLEEHALGGGLWLVSVETGWHPEDYGELLAANVWP